MNSILAVCYHMLPQLAMWQQPVQFASHRWCKRVYCMSIVSELTPPHPKCFHTVISKLKMSTMINMSIEITMLNVSTGVQCENVE